MWTCPNCGREFKRTNQSHYCGEAPKTVSEYINSQSIEKKPYLTKLTNLIKKSTPDVTETIKWSMPYFQKEGKSLSLSAGKNNISLYVGADVIAEFSNDLSEFSTKKSAIYFPYDKELPEELILRIVNYCLS